MDKEELYNKLTELTEELLYVSESESEFSVYEVESEEDLNSLLEDVSSSPAVAFSEENYTLFFEKTLAGLDTDDAGLQELKRRYADLFNFLQAQFDQVRVLKAGEVEKHIFICCKSGTEYFVLYTTAIET
jgi:hypothetical protein